jgi:hypothetical protein
MVYIYCETINFFAAKLIFGHESATQQKSRILQQLEI